MQESLEKLVSVLKQVLENPFPTDSYGRSLLTPDYKKGRLSAWLTIADYLEPYLDAATKEKVSRLQRAMTGSGYLVDRGGTKELATEPTFPLGSS
jgi:hypothetical protein